MDVNIRTKYARRLSSLGGGGGQVPTYHRQYDEPLTLFVKFKNFFYYFYRRLYLTAIYG